VGIFGHANAVVVKLYNYAFYGFDRRSPSNRDIGITSINSYNGESGYMMGFPKRQQLASHNLTASLHLGWLVA